MPEDLIPHNLNAFTVHQRVGDGYINLNQIADAADKRIGNWLRLQETEDLIAEFDNQMSVYSDLSKRSKALITVRGGVGGGGSTWAHPDIAIQFAQWCSPAFALQVSKWVREWMTIARNPLTDIDRVGLRDALKDDSRTRMTDQIKNYLEQIKRYDDRKYRGLYFVKVNDAINKAITTETAREMRNRLSDLIGREVKEGELIRDYFPVLFLNKYISLCEAAANLMLREGQQPLVAVERAAEIVLPASYIPKPIDFVEHIKNVRLRIVQNNSQGLPPE